MKLQKLEILTVLCSQCYISFVMRTERLKKRLAVQYPGLLIQWIIYPK